MGTPSQIADQSQPVTEALHWQAFESCLDRQGTLSGSEVCQACIQRLVGKKRLFPKHSGCTGNISVGSISLAGFFSTLQPSNCGKTEITLLTCALFKPKSSIHCTVGFKFCSVLQPRTRSRNDHCNLGLVQTQVQHPLHSWLQVLLDAGPKDLWET